VWTKNVGNAGGDLEASHWSWKLVLITVHALGGIKVLQMVLEHILAMHLLTTLHH